MRKIWVIAQREFLATVRTKAFLIGILAMPLMIGASVVFQVVGKRVTDADPRRFGVIDRTPETRAFKALAAANEARKAKFAASEQAAAAEAAAPSGKAPKDDEDAARGFELESIVPAAEAGDARDQQRLALSERVRKGELSGFLEIGPKAMDPMFSLDSLLNFGGAKPEAEGGDRNNGPATTRFQCKPTAPGAMSFFQFCTQEMMLSRLLGEKGRNPDTIKKLQSQKPPFVMLGLTQKGPDGKITDDEGAAKAMANFFVAYGAVMLMFMLIMMVAAPLMQSVLEEKMTKTSELLLGSASPFQLMAGKLAGGVGIAFTLAAIYLGGGLFALYRMGYGDQVPAAVVPWFLFYAGLSILMFGAMFVAIGSACTDMKDAQALMTPVMLPAMLPLFLLVPVLLNPNGWLARILSLIPPATPALMTARVAMGADIPWWEHALGVLGVALATLLCVWAAGRIFRIGFLASGKAPKLGELLRWVVKA